MFTDVGGKSEVRVMGLQADPWVAARSDIFIRYNLTKKVGHTYTQAHTHAYMIDKSQMLPFPSKKK